MTSIEISPAAQALIAGAVIGAAGLGIALAMPEIQRYLKVRKM